jgi:hypothetical protein
MQFVIQLDNHHLTGMLHKNEAQYVTTRARNHRKIKKSKKSDKGYCCSQMREKSESPPIERK